MKRKETLTGAGGKSSSLESPGVVSGISSTGRININRQTFDGDIVKDNAHMKGYARAAKKAKVGPLGEGFTIDGGSI